jgi:dolichol-phosphate mannosyltransferase
MNWAYAPWRMLDSRKKNDPTELESTSGLGALELAIVVPTYNEKSNVIEMLEALEKTMRGVRWEVIFVDDDSPDGTASKVREIALQDSRVRVLQRVGRRGLSSACMEGMLATAAPFIAVMDADLQHDESILPQMFSLLKERQLDLVIASRLVGDGSMGEMERKRVLLSSVGSRLSRFVCRCDLSDAMSGFFIVNRNFLNEVVHRLSGVGFKILVDLVASSPRPVRCAEVAYRFRPRRHGESKLDIQIELEYLYLLLDKTLGNIVPTRFVLFALVGCVGLVLHLAVVGLCYLRFGTTFVEAQAVGTLIAMVCNFLLNNVVTFRDLRLRGWNLLYGFLKFLAACLIGAIANVSFAGELHRNGIPWYLSGVSGLAVGSVWNYGVSSVFTWQQTRSGPATTSTASVSRVEDAEHGSPREG